MDELIAQFAIEARELVAQATEDLLSLEANPAGREHLESAFRSIHTLKGSVGLFDFGPMLAVLHQAEDLLSQARADHLAVDATLIDPLLAVVQWIDDSIPELSQTGRLSDAQEQQAPRLLGILTGKISDHVDGKVTARATDIPDWALSLRRRIAAPSSEGALVAIRYQPHPECFFSGDDPLATMTKVPDLRHLNVTLLEPRPLLEHFDPFRCHLLIEALSGASLAEAEAVFRLIPDQIALFSLPSEKSEQGAIPPQTPSERNTGTSITTMRVDPARIDKLVEIAGELVIAKNELMPLALEAQSHGVGVLARRIQSSHAEIERLVALLYGAVTQARMIPLEQTFRRFPRLVRDTSAKLGKPVDFIIEGETVEADREIVENLFEPLLHLVRNGLDHGIEPEPERLQHAKSPRGRLHLRARQSGDRIEIELSDDGRGIDPQQIRSAAVGRGVISNGQADALSDRDVLQLVFAPGFSTASQVSDMSGRGVGLDAVQRSVQRLGGSVELRSAVGFGTSFILKLPISFSMTQLMIVEVGGERYGIPMSDVIETHRLAVGDIQSVRAGQAFVLRDTIVPLLHLRDLLAMASSGQTSGDIKVLIAETADGKIGVAVDAIADRTETLTRPLAGLLQGLPGIAGTTLLGDGRVLLVLNMEELVP